MTIDTQIANYYEKLVIDDLKGRLEADGKTENELADIACVALNQLPARYYRFSVDMAFYLSVQEQHGMETEVEKAVTHALAFVSGHHRDDE
ncbi:late competence development ComFB family protein [Saccharospirillum impatiens]|uniref:late competence development ComFB family protein n=1 Tax=Saccharospirillum impatiens TaxID=169438 RepID=UPI0004051758|nr:late competence development ComFB family protein [Saccharospirillum impatiens]